MTTESKVAVKKAWLRSLFCFCAILTLAFASACAGSSGEHTDSNAETEQDSDADSNSDSSSDLDSGPDSDSEADSDSDTSSDTNTDIDSGDCADVDWGEGCGDAGPIGNLPFSGYADETGDHLVEQIKTTISMADLHCSGAKSLVVLVGDGD